MSSVSYFSVTSLEYFDVSRPVPVLEESTLAAEVAPTTAGVPEHEVEARILAACNRERAALEERLRAESAEREALQRRSVEEALRRFADERSSYFARVEAELVHLALAIARKILAREAQLDPMLLAGLVRIALDGMQGSPAVRLRVAPSRVSAWQQLKLHEHAEVLGDPVCGPEECVLETEVGSAQLSFETQMKEIEQGFVDLLGQRPDRAR